MCSAERRYLSETLESLCNKYDKAPLTMKPRFQAAIEYIRKLLNDLEEKTKKVHESC